MAIERGRSGFSRDHPTHTQGDHNQHQASGDDAHSAILPTRRAGASTRLTSWQSDRFPRTRQAYGTDRDHHIYRSAAGMAGDPHRQLAAGGGGPPRPRDAGRAVRRAAAADRAVGQPRPVPAVRAHAVGLDRHHARRAGDRRRHRRTGPAAHRERFRRRGLHASHPRPHRPPPRGAAGGLPGAPRRRPAGGHGLSPRRALGPAPAPDLGQLPAGPPHHDLRPPALGLAAAAGHEDPRRAPLLLPLAGRRQPQAGRAALGGDWRSLVAGARQLLRPHGEEAALHSHPGPPALASAGRGGRRSRAADGPHRARAPRRELSLPRVDIYTDGACRGNPGVGGWGALLLSGSRRKEIWGGERHTTNNRMELTAAVEALNALNKPCHVVLHTDSIYLRDGIKSWLANWKRKGWKTAAKKPVKNKDLWQALDAAAERHEIDWRWVKGHSGDPGNDRADELANRGIDELG